MFQIF
jgi:peptidoglycan/LPS O-acetylase OafA/YrhL